LPEARRRGVAALVTALADGSVELDAGADRERARTQLAELAGIGPWTIEMIAMRALGDPDAFPVTDMGVRRAAVGLGLPGSPRALTAQARRWRPWRSYAVQYLWGALDHPVNHWPPRGPR
ncbi:MAG: DNA-3-methyladenine glycosylase, partial [Actinomycetota bacterium]|nr:DNA-3-methyladenine glycosylase [Actinomycetota bacterium]